MSLETAAERRRKRIVELRFAGFPIAQLAKLFADTLEATVRQFIPAVKWRTYLAAQDTPLAIDETYTGPAACKVEALELPDDAAAQLVLDAGYEGYDHFCERYGMTNRPENQFAEVREKPQPQYVTLETARLNARVITPGPKLH